jgi:signal transduction histidine kinase
MQLKMLSTTNKTTTSALEFLCRTVRSTLLRRVAEAYMTKAGSAIRMAGIFRDITKQILQQQDAQRLQVLEHHEDFIATLTHDLKNPLIGADRLL